MNPEANSRRTYRKRESMSSQIDGSAGLDDTGKQDGETLFTFTFLRLFSLILRSSRSFLAQI